MAVIAFKTKAICMSPTRSFQIRQIKRFNLAINRRQIKENTREKLLGICIDGSLSWSYKKKSQLFFNFTEKDKEILKSRR